MRAEITEIVVTSRCLMAGLVENLEMFEMLAESYFT